MSATTLLRKNNMCEGTAPWHPARTEDSRECRKEGKAVHKYAELKELGSHPEIAGKRMFAFSGLLFA